MKRGIGESENRRIGESEKTQAGESVKRSKAESEQEIFLLFSVSPIHPFSDSDFPPCHFIKI